MCRCSEDAIEADSGFVRGGKFHYNVRVATFIIKTGNEIRRYKQVGQRDRRSERWASSYTRSYEGRKNGLQVNRQTDI